MNIQRRDLLEARCERDVYKSALQSITELDTSAVNSGVTAAVIAQVAIGVMSKGIGDLLDKIEVDLGL